SITVSGVSTDQTTTVDGVQYNLDYSGWYEVPASDGGYNEAVETFSFSLTGLVEGNHYIRLRTYDELDNYSSNTSIIFRVLSVASPGIVISETGEGTSVSENGETDTFGVVLLSEPSSNVVMYITLGGSDVL